MLLGRAQLHEEGLDEGGVVVGVRVAAWRATKARISHDESRPSRAIALSAAAELC